MIETSLYRRTQKLQRQKNLLVFFIPAGADSEKLLSAESFPYKPAGLGDIFIQLFVGSVIRQIAPYFNISAYTAAGTDKGFHDNSSVVVDIMQGTSNHIPGNAALAGNLTVGLAYMKWPR